MKAAIYTRISSDPQDTRAGVERQEDDCRRLIEHQGWELIEPPFEDNDRSAFSGDVRPKWQELQAAIGAGLVDVVVAQHDDRLTRNPRELEDFIDLCERHGVLVRTPFGQMNFAQGDDQFSARIKGAVAHKESQDKRRRLRSAHEDLARKGRWQGGGQRPFGYDRAKRPRDPSKGEGSDGSVLTLKPNPKEAKVLREAARRVLRDESLTSIARWLNDAGIRTTGGHRWSTGTLRRTLDNPAISGRRVHRRTNEVYPAEWPAIIPSDEHDLLLSRLRARGQRTGQPGPKRHPLTGILRCQRCGSRMVGSGDSYRCATVTSGCGFTRVAAWQAERVILDAVTDRWLADGSPSGAEPTSVELTDAERRLLAELAEVETKQSALAEELAGDLSVQDFRKVSRRLAQKADRLRDQLRDAAPTIQPSAPPTAASLIQDLKDVFDWERRWKTSEWTPAEVEEMHDWVAGYVDHVVVSKGKPGRRFDPSRLSIVWREAAQERRRSA